MKRCTGCLRVLPLDAFYLDRGERRKTRCKTCYNKPKPEPQSTAEVIAAADHRDAPSVDASKWPSVAQIDENGFCPHGEWPGECPECETPLQRRAREEAVRAARDARARAERHASDFDALKPDDFDLNSDEDYGVGVGNIVESKIDAKARSQASKEKRQEFNRAMGDFGRDMRTAAEEASQTGKPISEILPAKHSAYIKLLAEQEHRFGNRRWARSISIMEAHEQLTREAMLWVVENHFKEKVEPIGYARFPRPDRAQKRTACLLLSDLHLGAELDALDEPVAYRATEEARRLEYVLRQFIDYKPQYRTDTEALVILNGDIIEGDLQHDIRAGAPLAEQQAIFWKYFTAFIGHVAAAYPSVRVVCQPGNHGRSKLRHPGRATASKWDGIEWTLYRALEMMCSGLKNVRFDIPLHAVSIVDLYGQYLGVTHADTEVKLGDPDTKSTDNGRILDRINATRMYGVEFAAWVFGHFHKGRYVARSPRQLWNSALVPPNGHARTSGYIAETCGQWMFESVEGHPMGDTRFIEVGVSQDHDERLGSLIRPFRFSMADA